MGRIATFLLLTLVLAACGTDGGTFKINGRLLNLNQGEFYVYSPDGVIDGIDTMFVVAGRFGYKGSCDESGTLVIVFPNFSEQPVFVEPGKNIKVRGDVSHLKELKVTGTAENKLMNAFREKVKDAEPKDIPALAEAFVKEHPASLAALYLINRYFIRNGEPDYASAAGLMQICLDAQPGNGRLKQDLQKIKARAATSVGCKLPAFRAVTINGDTLTDKQFSKGTAVIYAWASSDFESCNIQRALNGKDNIRALGICLDPSINDCRRILTRDKIGTDIVCDSLAFDGSLVNLLGFSTLTENIIIENGKITARSLSAQEMRKRFPATNAPTNMPLRER
ncbi:MAG: DUF4369 domain-containing protein [Prevotella sp.]|nr:DUF4369 domain-containing protein [Prevotella sp.]